tara:strand:+ start:625 stop:927 length:303 start_codon:yes stop_codon:yes gene_type:complete
MNTNYYENYKGPNLVKAQLWKKGNEKENITDYIKSFYGEENNWNGKLYKYSEIFPNKDSSYHFYVEFLDDTNRKHWFHGMVGESHQIFNPPLASPMNQLK